MPLMFVRLSPARGFHGCSTGRNDSGTHSAGGYAFEFNSLRIREIHEIRGQPSSFQGLLDGEKCCCLSVARCRRLKFPAAGQPRPVEEILLCIPPVRPEMLEGKVPDFARTQFSPPWEVELAEGAL